MEKNTPAADAAGTEQEADTDAPDASLFPHSFTVRSRLSRAYMRAHVPYLVAQCTPPTTRNLIGPDGTARQNQKYFNFNDLHCKIMEISKLRHR